MTANDNFINLGNENIEKLALKFTGVFRGLPQQNTLDQIEKSLLINQKPLTWQYQQNMNANRTLLN